MKTLNSTGMSTHLTKFESTLLNKELGTWEEKQHINQLYPRWESLGMMLWALRIFKQVPEFHDTFPPKEVYTSTAIIPAFPKTVETFIEYFSSGEGRM